MTRSTFKTLNFLLSWLAPLLTWVWLAHRRVTYSFVRNPGPSDALGLRALEGEDLEQRKPFVQP
jgi:hypothetical protein